MAATNNQAQDLLKEFKAVNDQARNYLDGLAKKIAELDMKYAQHLVQNDINVMKAAKTILESKK
jgi:hypothetical protein